ncbi:MAG: hypothetical protein Q8K34_15940, partial [Hydrogenophaga sp.]|nr:hypothetical protein [Hydrogenophaga sp.]
TYEPLVKIHEWILGRPNSTELGIIARVSELVNPATKLAAPLEVAQFLQPPTYEASGTRFYNQKTAYQKAHLSYTHLDHSFKPSRQPSGPHPARYAAG